MKRTTNTFCHIALFALLIFMSSMVNAQNLKVESFRELATDMTARIEAPVQDQNGEPCALLKVTSNVLNDLEFESPALGIPKIVNKTGEKWVYVPAGSKRLTVCHSYCGVLRNYQYPVKIEKSTVYELKIQGNTDNENLNLTFANVTIKVEDNAEILVNGTSRGYGRWVGVLPEGTHNVECRLENHASTKQQITVKAGNNESFTMEKPIPYLGSLKVSTTPSGAKILIDGQNTGNVTPYTFNAVPVGSHNINFELENFNTKTHQVEINTNETTNLDVTLDTKVTFNSRPEDATIRINGKEISHTPYTTYLAPGDYTLSLDKEEYIHSEQQLQVGNTPLVKHTTLGYQYFKKNSIYANVLYQVGESPIFNVAVGAYRKGINVEVFFTTHFEMLTDMSVSYDFYEEEKYSEYEVKCFYNTGLKMGLLALNSNRMRITPQVGFSMVKISGWRNFGYKNYDVDINTPAISIGTHMDFAIIKNLAFTAIPEYTFPFDKTEKFFYNNTFHSPVGGFKLRLGVCYNINL